MLHQKGCKPKCRFSQVIILGKYGVDSQGMIRPERITFIIMQKRKEKNRNLILVSTRKLSNGIEFKLKSKL
jgi:hypothetical protein